MKCYKNDYEYVGILELDDDGSYYTIVKTTTPDGVYLEAGSTTNTGIIIDYGIDYDDDQTPDENLQRLYDHIIECLEQKRDIEILLADY